MPRARKRFSASVVRALFASSAARRASARARCDSHSSASTNAPREAPNPVARAGQKLTLGFTPGLVEASLVKNLSDPSHPSLRCRVQPGGEPNTLGRKGVAFHTEGDSPASQPPRVRQDRRSPARIEPRDARHCAGAGGNALRTEWRRQHRLSGRGRWAVRRRLRAGFLLARRIRLADRIPRHPLSTARVVRPPNHLRQARDGHVRSRRRCSNAGDPDGRRPRCPSAEPCRVRKPNRHAATAYSL